MRGGWHFHQSLLRINRFFFPFFLILFLTGGTALAQGSPSPDPGAAGQAQAAEAQAQQAQALTQALVTLNARLRRSGPGERGQLLGQLLDLAAARQELLGALIADQPGEVLKTALPERLASAMPSEVQGFLEQRQEIEGELQVFHVDAEDPSQSRYVYVLETVFGERFSLHFAAQPPGLLSGTPVGVTGLLLAGVEAEDFAATDGAIALESAETGVTTLECCNGTGAAAAAAGPELPNTFGEQRTAVLLFNFQDNPEEFWTIAEAESLVFGTTSDFFLENSYGQTWLAGDVFGLYTVPYSSSDCKTGDWRAAAEAAAAAEGVDLSLYSRLIYVHPYTSACPWSGGGTVGGNPSRAIINGKNHWSIFAHELGHNLGLFHSHALDCGSLSVGDSCTHIEYGDVVDVMGKIRAHFNAFQKELLGWLGHGTSPPLSTVESDGTYTLAPYGPDDSRTKALKILKSTDPVTGDRTWYYVTARRPIGFDSSVAVVQDVESGAIIHTGSESHRNTSYLLDMTPEIDTVQSRYYREPCAYPICRHSGLRRGRATPDLRAGRRACHSRFPCR